MVMPIKMYMPLLLKKLKDNKMAIEKRQASPMIRSILLSVFFTVLCFLLQACSTIPPELKNTSIISPGKVLVDHTLRREQRTDLEQLCGFGDFPIDPITTVEGPSGYGLDRRYEAAGSAMINMGSSCLAGSVEQCQSIIEMMVKWATANAAQVKSFGDDPKYWNDTLTVNLRVVRPFLGAYSIAKATVNPPTETDELIRQWMHRTVKRASHMMRTEGEYTQAGAMGTAKVAHNHAAASSAAWMAYGAMWGDDTAFQYGLEQWFITLGSMRQNGSLPIETRRGARALFYTGRTLSALVSIAEMARTNGIDLYTYSQSKEKTIHRAVQFMLDALEDNDLVIKYARENHVPGPSKNYRNQYLGGSGAFGWTYPYVSRFPDHPNSVRIKKFLFWSQSLCGDWIGGCSRCLYSPEKQY